MRQKNVEMIYPFQWADLFIFRSSLQKLFKQFQMLKAHHNGVKYALERKKECHFKIQNAKQKLVAQYFVYSLCLNCCCCCYLLQPLCDFCMRIQCIYSWDWIKRIFFSLYFSSDTLNKITKKRTARVLSIVRVKNIERWCGQNSLSWQQILFIAICSVKHLTGTIKINKLLAWSDFTR